ncbi:MAG: type II toxin-antitoxin system PemK/MazF family toxin [Desulfamplus sp.]|nr:type II toxin-antitoxin system PemK/MazF family toxin [Desulfamplus sp.]
MARGDVILIKLPATDGKEQSGQRPAIAIQADMTGEPMLMVVPVTSNLNALRFAFSVRIEPSLENGLTLPSVVMVFQMRAIDKDRIMRKIGTISQSDMTRIDEAIWLMLKPAS